MPLQRTLYKLHKIVSVLVGIQVLLWVFSGLYMTAVPLTYVHGDHLHLEKPAPVMEINETWLSPAEIKARYPDQPITNIRLFSRLGRGAYLLESGKNEKLIDAVTGKLVADLTESQVIEIARKAHTTTKEISSVILINNYSEAPEIKGRPLPIWQVNFDDWVNSTLYVSNIDARVITARSDIWRIFDFLWMLHIMDYDEREDFNNPLVIFMASIALLLVLTGAIMLMNGFKLRGWKYLN